MDALFSLSGHKCVLLAVQLASEADMPALKALCAARRDALERETLLRILLTYLPETADPASYASFAADIAADRVVYAGEDAPDPGPVARLPDAQAKRKVKALELLPLHWDVRAPPRASGGEEEEGAGGDAGGTDLFERFVVQRAYRMDDAAQLDLVPQLVEPYVEDSPALRSWLVSSVLPLLRFGYEYYPETEATTSLERFDGLSGARAVELLLSRSREPRNGEGQQGVSYNGARDMRSLMGPWMYGSRESKRRKLNGTAGSGSTSLRAAATSAAAATDVQRIEEDGAETDDLQTGHEWEYAFEWLGQQAAHDLPLVTDTLENWDGPSDVDLGGYVEPGEQVLDTDTAHKLRLQYVQCAYAAAYAVESDATETLEGIHGLLVRLADLMEFEPPPDLATSVEMLPRLDSQTSILHETSSAVLLPEVLLKQGHPLTTPNEQTYALLQLFLYSAYILSGLGHAISIVNIAKHRYHATADEQMALLQKLLHHASSGPRKNNEEWTEVRNRLLWLWSWGMDSDSRTAQFGAGILGKIDRSMFSREIMQTLLSAGCYDLVRDIWLNEEASAQTRLLRDEVQDTIISTALHFYDNASNGNRTRGGMKRASDIIANFRPSFPDSAAFRRCAALLAATHALSFYSLTLQHGVPFKPVNIRVSKDPLSLLNKVLEQNPRSYTKLDDLISIGTNLVSAGLPDPRTAASDDLPSIEPSVWQLEDMKTQAERRVTGMAIEQALHEDDFETAYSYVTTRLKPEATAPPTAPTGDNGSEEDDLSWRAAFIAGRHRSATDTASSRVSSGAASLRRPGVRRLEQRMELLSQALLLAPPPHLPEVLAAWRRCEEEMDALARQEADEDDAFDDRADGRRTVPGGFGPPSEAATPQPQARREVGRGAVEEAPMGLFDVMGGAAKALSRTVHGPRAATAAAATAAGSSPRASMEASTGSLGSGDDGSVHSGMAERMRKRDMVANAASGALASGLGWVLGATPVNQRPPSR